MKKILLHSIRFYQQALGPFLPRVCRFIPSCSQYAYEAIEQYGIGRGLAAAAWRILRCNPFGTGGYDPVRSAGAGSGSGLNHGHHPGAAHE